MTSFGKAPRFGGEFLFAQGVKRRLFQTAAARAKEHGAGAAAFVRRMGRGS